MTRCSAAMRGVGFLIALLWTAGCMPPPGAGDESQAERYLSAGKARAQRQDFTGAVAAFEQALRADPRLAKAHHELAVTFDTQLNAPEKALYHYIRTLELQPDHQWADLISNRVGVVRMQLARDSVPSIPSPQLAKEIDRLEQKVTDLTADQQRLLAENEDLRTRLAALSHQPSQQPRPGPGLASNPGPGDLASSNRTDRPVAPITGATQPPWDRGEGSSTAPRYVLHQIQKGDSLYGLGRRHGVAVDEILKANPGFSPQNFPIGKTIRIPVK